MLHRYVRFKRCDRIAARLHANVGITGEHSRTDVPCQLTDRFLRDVRIFREPGNERMAGVVKTDVDASLRASGIERRSVARITHGPVGIYAIDVRSAVVSCDRDMMEREHKRFWIGVRKTRQLERQRGASSLGQWDHPAGSRLRF